MEFVQLVGMVLRAEVPVLRPTGSVVETGTLKFENLYRSWPHTCYVPVGAEQPVGRHDRG